MKGSVIFLALWSLLFILAGCGENKKSVTINIGSRNGDASQMDSWQHLEALIPIDVGDRDPSETFRGLSFSDGVIAVAQYDTNGELNDLCRTELTDGDLYGACFNPMTDSDIKCFVEETFVDEAYRESTICEEVYQAFSDERNFSCRKKDVNGQTSLYCSDGSSILVYEDGTLCRVNLSSESGQCIDSDDNVEKFQATTWGGYRDDLLLIGAPSSPLSPLPLENVPLEATLSYETLTPNICSVSDGMGAGETPGEVTGIFAGTCLIKLTVSADEYVDKELNQSIEIEDDVQPSFSLNATITDISAVVGVAISTVALPTASSGNGDLTYSITPTLPTGLTFDGGTRELSGTPAVALSSTSFTYEVSDNNGDTERIGFNVAITKGQQSFDWPSSPYGSSPSLEVGRELSLRTTITGGKGTLSFRSGGDSDCSVTPAGVVSSSQIGLCIVEAQWTGDDDWLPTDWQQFLYVTIAQGTQNFSWPANAYGATPSLAVNDAVLSLAESITGGEGGLEFRSSNTNKCTVDGIGQVSGIATGSCTIDARWAGDDNWLATSWHQLLGITVYLYLEGITWGHYSPAIVGGASVAGPITLPTGASDDYVRNSGSCSVDPNSGTVTALGETTLTPCSVTVTVAKSGYAPRTHTYTVTIISSN